MESLAFVALLLLIIESAGGLSNENLFGNFGRWDEPNRSINSIGKAAAAASSATIQGDESDNKVVNNLVSGKGSEEKRLHIQVYRTLMDAVVLDWTISLSDKDRMKSCAVTYLPKEEAKESTITIDPFMPKSRTFLLENLRPNTIYSFKMTCLDERSGSKLVSDSVEFRTEAMAGQYSMTNSSSEEDVIDHHKHRSTSTNNYLTEMNLKLLPAISNSIQDSSNHHNVDPAIKTTSKSRSYLSKMRTSPHAVLGVSCAIFGAILAGVTVALALRRYSQHKRSQTRLWELHATTGTQEEDQTNNADMDFPAVQLPTFINLPPPYSEQPSPLYNLCASSSISSSVAAASAANFCDQHLMSVMSSTNSCYCHLQHHHHFCTTHSIHHGNSFYSSSISESIHVPKADAAEDNKEHKHEEEQAKSSTDTEQNTTDTESTSAF